MREQWAWLSAMPRVGKGERMAARMRNRGLIIAGVALGLIAVPGVAQASIGLPHAYTITFINGGSDGASSDVFRTTNGKICVSFQFKVKKKKDNGAWPDRNYTIRLYKNTFGGGDLKKSDPNIANQSLTVYSGGKTCWTGMENNVDYYLNWQKNIYDTGQLNGYGTISTS